MTDRQVIDRLLAELAAADQAILYAFDLIGAAGHERCTMCTAAGEVLRRVVPAARARQAAAAGVAGTAYRLNLLDLDDNAEKPNGAT